MSPDLPFAIGLWAQAAMIGCPNGDALPGMRARLAFAISMAIEFDCFLIDEVISVGDTRFYEKCRQELFDKRRDRSMIIVSHEAHNIREHCSRACVLANGRLREFADVDAAYTHYQAA